MSGGVVLALFNVGRMHSPRFECWFNPSGFYPVGGHREDRYGYGQNRDKKACNPVVDHRLGMITFHLMSRNLRQMICRQSLFDVVVGHSEDIAGRRCLGSSMLPGTGPFVIREIFQLTYYVCRVVCARHARSKHLA